MHKFLENRVVIVGLLILALGSAIAPEAANSQGEQSCFPNDQLHRVSITHDGSEPNGPSYEPILSADGQYVAFVSEASNLVENDTNGVPDIFWVDRATCEIARVSVASDGTPGDYSSLNPFISADGQVVVFESQATNLTPHDTNFTWDIFAHNLRTAETYLLVDLPINLPRESIAAYSISADTQLVAFQSSESNLVEGDTNNSPDIFVYDRRTGETTRVSVSSEGSEAQNGATDPLISSDGRYIAFTAIEPSWPASATIQCSISYTTTTDPESYQTIILTSYEGCADVFIHDRATGETLHISSAPFDATWNGWISLDGNFAVRSKIAEHDPATTYPVVTSATGRMFVSEPNLLNSPSDLTSYIHALDAPSSRAVLEPYVGTSLQATLSGDGQWVAFMGQVRVGGGVNMPQVYLTPVQRPPTLIPLPTAESATLLLIKDSSDMPAQRLNVTLPGENHQWVMGDWDGDLVETPGAYADDGIFYYTNSLDALADPSAWSSLNIGLPNRPVVAGRLFNGYPSDCVGVMDWQDYSPDHRTFAVYFTCDLMTAPRQYFDWYDVIFTNAVDFDKPFQVVMGDWDDDGVDSLAVWQGTTMMINYDRPASINSISALARHQTEGIFTGTNTGFQMMQPFELPEGVVGGTLIAGDWDGDGRDSFGIYTGDNQLYLRNDLDWEGGEVSLREIGE